MIPSVDILPSLEGPEGRGFLPVPRQSGKQPSAGLMRLADALGVKPAMDIFKTPEMTPTRYVRRLM